MRMRFLVTGALAVCLAAPATALAGEPTETDKTNAAKECKAERTELGVEAFRAKYGTSRSKGRNAFGKCVSKHAKKHLKAADRADRKEMRSKARP